MTSQSAEVEYRVKWRRVEGGQVTKIYQTREAAYRKATGILALEQVKDDTTFETMAPLADGPVIEMRQVGGWHQCVDAPLATEEDEHRMREWAEAMTPDNYSGIF